MYWNMAGLGLSYTGIGAVQVLPSGEPREMYVAADAALLAVR